MIAKSTVKHIRMTGLGKRKPLRIANVVLKKEWLGKKVFILEHNDYIDMNKKIKRLQTISNTLKRALYES